MQKKPPPASTIIIFCISYKCFAREIRRSGRRGARIHHFLARRRQLGRRIQGNPQSVTRGGVKKRFTTYLSAYNFGEARFGVRPPAGGGDRSSSHVAYA
ncbi:hypothetical protein L596_014041 [Steinernema carpocapsae]|uniref:Uncharacterized protein n=1 Tax=Steinernema carpocapsae TaxID=34508 RepID=A0A4V6A2L9_STECR|nr:hypothetical protein L596_014041 [Steinernema carpocapsae]